jgi:hypothetical protein
MSLLSLFTTPVENAAGWDTRPEESCVTPEVWKKKVKSYGGCTVILVMQGDAGNTM